MTDDVKLPRKLSEEPKAPKPQRPSHGKVIENLDRWANSPALQPPMLPAAKTTLACPKRPRILPRLLSMLVA
jgi:hypothetical protein